ncbi:MAG: nitroreductase family protein [Candidatus Bathyarchaeia archaeon]
MRIPDVIRDRRSVRAFSGGDLSDDDVETLVEAACLAPSAGNRQPWEFVVVRKPENKGRLAEAAYGQSFVAEAPVVFVVCADPGRSASRYGRRGVELYCLQDTAAAVENLLLTAVANGLGGCWVGAFDESRVKEIIGAPGGVRPVAIVPVGHPHRTPPPRPRRSPSEVIHRERF